MTAATLKLRLTMVQMYNETELHNKLASKNEVKIEHETGGGTSIVILVEPFHTSEKDLVLQEKKLL